MPQQLTSLNIMFCGRTFPLSLVQGLIPQNLVSHVLEAHTTHHPVKGKLLLPLCLLSKYYRPDLCLESCFQVSMAFHVNCKTVSQS